MYDEKLRESRVSFRADSNEDSVRDEPRQLFLIDGRLFQSGEPEG